MILMVSPCLILGKPSWIVVGVSHDHPPWSQVFLTSATWLPSFISTNSCCAVWTPMNHKGFYGGGPKRKIPQSLDACLMEIPSKIIGASPISGNFHVGYNLMGYQIYRNSSISSRSNSQPCFFESQNVDLLWACYTDMYLYDVWFTSFTYIFLHVCKIQERKDRLDRFSLIALYRFGLSMCFRASSHDGNLQIMPLVRWGFPAGVSWVHDGVNVFAISKHSLVFLLCRCMTASAHPFLPGSPFDAGSKLNQYSGFPHMDVFSPIHTGSQKISCLNISKFHSYQKYCTR